MVGESRGIGMSLCGGSVLKKRRVRATAGTTRRLSMGRAKPESSRDFCYNNDKCKHKYKCN